MITAERLREVLAYDSYVGTFTWKVQASNSVKRGQIAGLLHPLGYHVIRIDRRAYMAHRLAWLYVTGKWPKEEIDHINGVKNDNRFHNLREATRRDNQRNTTKTCKNKSGFKGVTRQRQKWKANIRISGKPVHLGVFDTPEKAHAAYMEAAKKHFGEFARG